jgi:hypothetical protein
LSPDEVVAKTKGWCLDTILKVANI